MCSVLRRPSATRRLPRLPALLLLLLSGCAGTAGAEDRLPPATAPGRDAGDERPLAVGDSARAPETTDTAGEPRLADLLRIALRRSPRIQAARERAIAAGEGAAIEGWLPDPVLMLGWYETPVETRVGPQDWSIGVQQRIPFPTKLIARARIEDVAARRAVLAYERTVRDVLVDVVRSAHEVKYLDDAVRITSDVAALLDRYVAAAAGEETSSSLPELFRAETQRAQLENDRVILAELRAAEAQHLRGLLALAADAPVGTPRVGPVPRVDTDFAGLLAVAEEHSQELRDAGLAVEQAGLRSALERQRWVPDLTVGVTRIDTDRLPASLGMDPRGNGEDPVILQFGATLPLWAHRDAAAVRRARALERAAALDRADLVQRLRDQVARAWFAVGNAERLGRLYDEVLVPRARVAARTAEDLLASGKGSLAGNLETIAVLHNFRLAAARARADHGRALAELEGVLGRPLSPLSAVPAEAVR